MTEFEKARDEARMKKEYLVIAQVQEFDAGADWAYEWCQKNMVTDLHLQRLNELGKEITSKAEMKKEAEALADALKKYENAHGFNKTELEFTAHKALKHWDDFRGKNE